MNRQLEIEPQLQDEDDWLCTVELVPSDDTEGRLFAADIIGYLFVRCQGGPSDRSRNNALGTRSD